MKGFPVFVVTIALILFSCDFFAEDNKGGGSGGGAEDAPIINSVDVLETAHPGVRVNLTVDAQDPNGESLDYAYEFVGNLQGQIDGGNSAAVEITLLELGEHTILVTVTNQSGLSTEESVIINGVNNAPEITEFTANPSPAGPNDTVNVLTTVTDPDQDELTFVYSSDISQGEFTGSGANVTYSPMVVGTHTLSVTVTDDLGGSDIQSLSLVVEDLSISIDSFTSGVDLLAPGESTSLTAVASGGEGNLNYVFSADSGDISGISGNTATYTAVTSGADTITVSVTDQNLNTTESALTIEVNSPPTITSFVAANNNIGRGMSTGFNLSTNDPDGDTLSFSFEILTGDGEIVPSGSDAEFTATSYGNQVIQLTIEDGFYPGVSSTTELTVESQWQTVGVEGIIPGDILDMVRLSDQIVVLYYYDSDSDNSEDQIRMASFSNEAWNLNRVTPLEIETFDRGWLVEDQGSLYLLANTRDENFDYYRGIYSWNGSDNSWTEVLAPSAHFSMDYAGFVVDNGEYYLAHKDNSTNQVVVDLYSGGSWSQMGGALSAGEGYYIEIALNTSGTPYVAFTDDHDSDGGSTDRITKVSSWNGSSWASVGVEGFTAGEADFLVLKMDGDTPYLGFKDDANSDRMTIMSFGGSSWADVGDPGFPYYLGGAGDPNALGGALDFLFQGSNLYAGYIQYGLPGFNQGAPSVSFYDGDWETVTKHITGDQAMDRMHMALSADDVVYFVSEVSGSNTATVFRYQ